MPFLIRPLDRRVFGFGILLAALAAVFVPARAEVSKEYQVKAVFLFNFAQFIQWPPKTFAKPNEPFLIGILGEDPFGSFLDETIRGEKVDGHPLVVRRYKSLEDVKICQILFVGRSEKDHWKEIFESVKGKRVLTVGDEEGFVRNGGVLRFVTRDNKIKLRVSTEAAKREKLVISSKVLRLAEIVETEKK